jgi:hypothetical protein
VGVRDLAGLVSGHTPGPWTIDHHTDRGEGRTVRDVDGLPIARVDGGSSSYGVDGHKARTHDGRDADAALIAAAPDLLAAAELVLEAKGLLISEFEVLEAAIQKAKGQA